MGRLALEGLLLALYLIAQTVVYYVLDLYPILSGWRWKKDPVVYDLVVYLAGTFCVYAVSRIGFAIASYPFKKLHELGYVRPCIQLIAFGLATYAILFQVKIIPMVTNISSRQWKNVIEAQVPSMVKEMDFLFRLFVLVMFLQLVGLTVTSFWRAITGAQYNKSTTLKGDNDSINEQVIDTASDKEKAE